ncbi:MAG: tail fiber domain-containing protein, partial [Bacteroidota bacterium]
YIEARGTSEIAVRGDLRPTIDNAYDLGTSALRYNDVFATSGVVNTSDVRMKKDIEPIPYGLTEVMKMNPVRFNWKETNKDKPKLGLLAQDLLPLINEVVVTHNWEASEEDDTQGELVELDRLGVYYSDLIPVLIQAIQDLKMEVDDLKAQLNK